MTKGSDCYVCAIEPGFATAEVNEVEIIRSHSALQARMVAESAIWICHWSQLEDYRIEQDRVIIPR
jgi:hypothetical protein